MSLDVIRDWGPLAFTAFGNLLLAWLGTKFAGKREVVEARQAALDAHHRIDLIKKDLEGLPNYDVTNRLNDSLKKLEVAVEGLTATMKANDQKADTRAAAIARIEDYLLTNARSGGGR